MFTPIISSEGTKTVDEIASLFKFRFIIKYLLCCLCYGLIHQPGPVDCGKVDRPLLKVSQWFGLHWF